MGALLSDNCRFFLRQEALLMTVIRSLAAKLPRQGNCGSS
jgi:hypothetical protein